MFKTYLSQIFGSWIITLISLVILQLVGQGSNETILHFLYWTSLTAPYSLIINETFGISAAKKVKLTFQKS